MRPSKTHALSPQSSAPYQDAFELALEPLAILDQQGHFEESNPAFQQMFEGRAPVNAREIAPTEQSQRPFSLETLELEGRHEDLTLAGGLRVDCSVRHLSDGRRLLGFRDVTERARLQDQLTAKHHEIKEALVRMEKAHSELRAIQDVLLQSAKMVAIGELASGIAHELNQPLLGIRGFAQELVHLRDQVAQGAQASFDDHTGEIIRNADKMSKIISTLRSFARKSTDSFEWVDVAAVVRDGVRIVTHDFKNHQIECEVDGFEATGFPKVFGNAIHLEQVIVNLLTNARDAINETKRGRGRVRIQAKFDPKFVTVSVQDDGAGIPEAVKAKIFNPFFTTKEVGRGMGLGLSLSFGLIQKINGSLVAESEPGRGTEFIVRLPIDFRNLS